MTNALNETLARCRRGLWAVAGFNMVINLLMLTVALFMLQIYDRVLTSQSLQMLVYLSMIAVGALVLLAFELLRSRILVRVESCLDRVLSPSVFQRGSTMRLPARAIRLQLLPGSDPSPVGRPTMADSVYTADLFGSPSRAALPVLASDKSHSRNLNGDSDPALTTGLADSMQPLFLLAELALAHDFAVEQHSSHAESL